MIAVRDLSLRIGETPILQNVSFKLGHGQVLGLVGESGSGKSMSALSVMQLLPRAAIVEGDIQFKETNLLSLTERHMCRLRGAEIGMIFQEPMTALNPVQTIGDQVAETLLIHKAAKRSDARTIAAEKLARVGLDPTKVPLDRYPHQLSGGQRQRVCIAMAIALRPKLLIADEPTTALDVTTQAQILDLLRDLVHEEQMGLLLITHDLAVVSAMADTIAVMKNGQIVESGSTKDILFAHQHPYTTSLLKAASHAPHRMPRRNKNPLLRATNVTRSYPAARAHPFAEAPLFNAVDDVSFSINTGESLGLVGESGCGKSTLSRAILGLDPIQAGQLELTNEIISPQMPNTLRQRMQVVFQDPYASFNPRHKVARILKEPFHLNKKPKDIDTLIETALVDVGLAPSDADKFPHEFSGGQRQRVAIARALITRPDLIVLDEAVSALDVQVRAQILDLLADLQDRYGLTYLFISHDLHVVRAVTDRVMVMQRGRIVERAETEALFSDPKHPYTRALLAAAPKLETA